jgi:hypothetical protein
MVRRLLVRFAVAHADELRVHVTRNPLAAVGVAFVAGLAAGSTGYTSRLVRRETIEAALAIVGSMLFAAARDGVMRSARDWMQQRTVH